jgi:putative DNA methylase
MTEPKSEWHSRGFLPHWEAGESPQFITFRLDDSLPRSLIDRWKEDLRDLAADPAKIERHMRIEAALDKGHGSAVLADPRVGSAVETSLQHFDGVRYRLHDWVVMPNHVHVLATPLGDHTLSQITHGWKSFTARIANHILSRDGRFWAPEYFDRAIRTDQHYRNTVGYIAMNPVKAGLCASPAKWRYSSFWSETERNSD